MLCDTLAGRGGSGQPCAEQGLPNGENEAHPFFLSSWPHTSFQTSKAEWPCGSGYPQLGNPGAIPLPGSQGDTPTHTRKLEDELNLHLAVGVCYSWLLGSLQSVLRTPGSGT